MELFFFTSDVPRRAFILFGTSHMLTIVVMTLIAMLIIRSGKNANEATRGRFRLVMVVVFIFWEAEWQIWHLMTDTWNLQNNLPLHMCSMMIWVSVYGLWTGDRRVYPLMYFFGISGAVQAIITPDSLHAFPHLRYLNTIISHGLLVISGLWVVLVEGYRPTFKAMWSSILGLNIYAAIIYVFDLWIGANYLYVTEKPALPSIMDFFPEWPWYIPVLEVLIVLIMLGMYMPFAFSHRVRYNCSPE